MVSLLNSYYVFLKYVKLFEMQRSRVAEGGRSRDRGGRRGARADPARARTRARRCSPCTSTPRGPGAADRTRCS